MSEKAVVELFAGSGRRRMANGLELRVVPAFAVLQARREAMDACAEDAAALGLWMNACLLSRAVYRDGARAFLSGEAVLQAVSAETVEDWTKQYAALCREENPACSAENAQRAAQALGEAEYERLKWRVLKSFGVLPGEARAKRMTDGDYLYCAAQMMLDAQEKLDALCPTCREKAQRARCPVCGEEPAEQNAGFDEMRFEELRHGRVCDAASAGAGTNCGAV